MKGGIRMLIVITSSLASIACHGCVSGSQAYTATTAAPQSEAMILAVPGLMGDGALNQPSAGVLGLGQASVAASATPGPRTAFQSVISSGEETRITFALTDGESPFGLTGNASQPGPFDNQALNWMGGDALSLVAANVAAARHGRTTEVSKDISVGLDISASSAATGLAFDVGLAPRFGVRDEGDLSSQRLGGEVRFGQGLTSLVESNGQPEGWYVFIGADGEALVWDADTSRLASSMGELMLTDQVTVGDMQAGVSIQRGGGELSLSYIRREIKFDDRNRSMSDTEDFAGLTFTMRR